MSLLSTLAQTTSEFNFDSFESFDTSSLNTASDQLSNSEAAAVAGLGLVTFFVVMLVAIAVYLFMSFCLMKIFKKAGRQDAWAAFVPIYNTYVLFEIAGRPGWWVFLAFIPFVGGLIVFVLSIIAMIDLAKSFGKSSGYAALLILLPIIGYPMLAFDESKYQGPAGPEGGTPPQTPAAQPQSPTQTPPTVQ